MLWPFIFARLECATALHILNQVILQKPLYASSIWYSNDTVSLYLHLKVILNAHYNPSSDSLHILSGALSTRLLATTNNKKLDPNKHDTHHHQT